MFHLHLASGAPVGRGRFDNPASCTAPAARWRDYRLNPKSINDIMLEVIDARVY